MDEVEDYGQEVDDEEDNQESEGEEEEQDQEDGDSQEGIGSNEIINEYYHYDLNQVYSDF